MSCFSRKASARARRAGERARSDLREASRLLMATPECRRTERIEEKDKTAEDINLPWLTYHGIKSIVEDIGVEDAARLLRSDIRENEKNMAEAIRENYAPRDARRGKSRSAASAREVAA